MATQEHEGATRTFIAAGAIGQHKLVKLDGSGQLVVTVATDATTLGKTQRETFNADEAVAVRGLGQGYSHKLVAAGTIAVGATVYTAADGKVDDAGTNAIGVALTAAGADGHYVEVRPTIN